MIKKIKKGLDWFRKLGAIWGLSIGVVGVFVFLMIYSPVVKYTNSMGFCTSCHSMTIPYEEYKKSSHFNNSIGVQAECKDCHVPREYPDLLIAKIMAAKDVYHEILGTVDTKEKYEEHRLKMAKAVWAKMERRESRECRNCHELTDMLIEEHGRRARRLHKEAMEKGQHCINCHKGVAHELPQGYEG